MGIFNLLLFLILPFFSFFIAIVGLFFDKQHTKVYCLIIALIAGLIAYFYVPNYYEDLYYHLHTIDILENINSSGRIVNFDLNEPVTLLIKLFVSLFKNPNLLQFLVSTVSYFLTIYMTIEMTKKYNKFIRIICLIFVLSTFNFMTVISNLFCNLGLMIFIYGIYREYFLEKKDAFNIVIYILSFLTHNSLIFPCVVLHIYKVMNKKGKNLIRTIIISVLVIFLIPTIMNLLSNFSSFKIVNQILEFYNSYFINNSDFKELHTTNTLYLYFAKMFPFIIGYLFTDKCKSDISKLSIVFVFSICVLTLSTTFSIRFIPIVVMLGIETIAKCLSSSKNKYGIVVLLLSMLTTIPVFLHYQIVKTNLNQFAFDSNILLKNIFSLLNSGK